MTSRSGLTPTGMLALQRSAGNQAATTLTAGHGSPVTVQREVSAEDRTWAQTSNTSVERVQDAVSAAQTRLNADTELAITSLDTVRTGFTAFETRYYEAADRFTRGVRTAQTNEQQRRDGLAAAASLVLFAAAGPWAVASNSTVAMLRTVNDSKGYVDALTATGQVGTAVLPASTLPAPPPATLDPGRPRDLDWSAAMSTAINTLRTSLQQNRALQSISETCTRTVRYLGHVRDGSHPGADARTGPEGVAAQALAEHAADVVARLAAIGPGTISGPAQTFQSTALPLLTAKTGHDLEQEMALRWISRLGDDQLDEIDTADEYLKNVGIIDANGNRLSMDTGSYTTDVDERLIRMLARVETAAMDHVGTAATWLGGTSLAPGMRVFGRVRDDHNREWNASAPAGTTTEGGGSVRIESYQINREDRSGWTSYGQAEQQQMYSEVLFRVRPVGNLGGGAPAPTAVLNAG